MRRSRPQRSSATWPATPRRICGSSDGRTSQSLWTREVVDLVPVACGVARDPCGTGAGDIYPPGVFSCLGQQTTRIKARAGQSDVQKGHYQARASVLLLSRITILFLLIALPGRPSRPRKSQHARRDLTASSVRSRRADGSSICHNGSSMTTSRSAKTAGSVDLNVSSSVMSLPVIFSRTSRWLSRS